MHELGERACFPCAQLVEYMLHKLSKELPPLFLLRVRHLSVPRGLEEFPIVSLLGRELGRCHQSRRAQFFLSVRYPHIQRFHDASSAFDGAYLLAAYLLNCCFLAYLLTYLLACFLA